MRNPLRLFGFGSSDRRRSPSGRAYPSMAPAPRRYEVPRAEPLRPSASTAPRRTTRSDHREVNWRRRGMIALTSLGVIAVAAGGIALFRSDLLRVRVIDVNGTQVADPQAIAAAAGISGASMLTLNLAHASQNIAKLPAVKSATVTREWPQGIRIDITEHQAWGYWQAGPQRLVIDEGGNVLDQSRPPAADAPTIVEVLSGTPNANDVAPDTDTVQLVNRLRTDGTFDRLQVKPTSYVFRRDRGLTVIVASGPAAVLGDSSNYDFKVRTWQSLLDKVRAGQVPQVQVPSRPASTPQDAARGVQATAARSGSSASVSEIDLRFGRNVALR